MCDSEPTPVLRSAANPKVRQLMRMRDNRARRRAGLVIVDGWRETARAIRGGLHLKQLFLGEHDPLPADVREDPEIRVVLGEAAKQQHLHRVSQTLLDKIGYGQSSRGVVAEFSQPDDRLDQLSLTGNPLLLILDRVEKPGNVGAVFRCADAAGAHAVILCDCGCDAFNPNAIRSSLGAVFRVPTASAGYSELTAYLETRGIRAIASRVESSTCLWSADLSAPLAVVLGSEATGLQDRWQHLGDDPIEGIRIPMFGEVDSLNVSVSAALLAFEAARQRDASTDRD